jgi:hypothetical protein
MNIEMNSYGFCVDSHFFYIALSWGTIITVSVVIAIILGYKKWNNRK